MCAASRKRFICWKRGGGPQPSMGNEETPLDEPFRRTCAACGSRRPKDGCGGATPKRGREPQKKAENANERRLKSSAHSEKEKATSPKRRTA
jgi:hypothetical protein